MKLVQYVLGVWICSIISSSCAFQAVGKRMNTPTVVTTPLFALKVEKTDDEWKEVLQPDQYNVLRREGTEPPWTSPLNEAKEDGTFRCAGCKAALFRTSTKFESGSGWPSFYSPIDDESIDLNVDFKLVMPRTEVTCKSCGGHLGHVFDDGPRPTGKRYCMNGVAMDFISDVENPTLAMEATERSIVSGKIKQPLMAALPSIGFDIAIAALFITSFIRTNNDAGWTLFSNGFSIGQTFGLFPIAVGAFYAASSIRKAVDLAMPSE